MGLLDKLKGKMKADSSKAGNSALPFYLTLKWASISISLHHELLKERHRKFSAIAVDLPATSAVYNEPNDRHCLH